MTDKPSEPQSYPRSGSLRDALAAAARTYGTSAASAAAAARTPPTPGAPDDTLLIRRPGGAGPAKVPAAAQQAGPAPAAPVSAVPVQAAMMPGGDGGDAKTRLIRGRQKVDRASFNQDPVVGWLVVVGGPGLGSFRPVYEGNNTIGRAKTQRVPIDFGDDSISSEEQAFIRYDSADRRFLLIPNLSKTNVVSVNDTKPTSAVELQAMDVLMIGRTQLAFVPFCGEGFDWSELTEGGKR